MPQKTGLVNFEVIRHDIQPFHDEDGYTTRCLFQGESCVIVSAQLGAGARGPARHVVTQSDQVLFVLDGELNVELGTEIKVVGPETMVFVPMGTSLHLSNAADSDSRYIHVLTPAPVFGRPVTIPVESPVVVGRPIVRRVLDVENRSPLPTFVGRLMLCNEDGSEHAAFPYLELPPEGKGPPLHYHQFDMFLIVLAGEVTVDIVFERFTAVAGDCVVFRAGTPHAQFNLGDVPAKILAVNAPHPVARPWEYPVHLTPAERDYMP